MPGRGCHDRRTVRKALQDAGPPRYTLREHSLKPVLGPFTLLVDRWLKEDLAQPSKQRHTARRIYHRLVAEHGFAGGESTVREYVREHRPRPPDRFIRDPRWIPASLLAGGKRGAPLGAASAFAGGP